MSRFDSYGGYFAPQGYMKVNEGGSHAENPNGGVQVGTDSQGTPNLLEEGEPVYDDYVFSDNIKADAEILEKYNIPAKYAGKLYSEIADAIVDEAADTPNDPIANNGLNKMLARLAEAQEEQKAIEDRQSIEKDLDGMSPEELQELESALAQHGGQEVSTEMMGQQQVPEQAMQSSPDMAAIGAEPQQPVMFAEGGTMDEDNPEDDVVFTMPFPPNFPQNRERVGVATTSVPETVVAQPQPNPLAGKYLMPGYDDGETLELFDTLPAAGVVADLPKKFNGSQEAAARYAQSYQWGQQNVAQPRDEFAGEIAPYVLGLVSGPAGAISALAGGTVDNAVNVATRGKKDSWGDLFFDENEHPWLNAAADMTNPAYAATMLAKAHAKFGDVDIKAPVTKRSVVENVSDKKFNKKVKQLQKGSSKKEKLTRQLDDANSTAQYGNAKLSEIDKTIQKTQEQIAKDKAEFDKLIKAGKDIKTSTVVDRIVRNEEQLDGLLKQKRTVEGVVNKAERAAKRVQKQITHLDDNSFKVGKMLYDPSYVWRKQIANPDKAHGFLPTVGRGAIGVAGSIPSTLAYTVPINAAFGIAHAYRKPDIPEVSVDTDDISNMPMMGYGYSGSYGGNAATEQPVVEEQYVEQEQPKELMFDDEPMVIGSNANAGGERSRGGRLFTYGGYKPKYNIDLFNPFVAAQNRVATTILRRKPPYEQGADVDEDYYDEPVTVLGSANYQPGYGIDLMHPKTAAENRFEQFVPVSPIVLQPVPKIPDDGSALSRRLQIERGLYGANKAAEALGVNQSSVAKGDDGDNGSENKPLKHDAVPAPLPTWQRAAGVVDDLAQVIHNLTQKDEDYTVPYYPVATPSVSYRTVPQRYESTDPGILINPVLANGAGLYRSALQAGSGPGTMYGLAVADNSVTNALGAAQAQAYANALARQNAVAEANNKVAQERAQIELAADNARAEAINTYYALRMKYDMLAKQLQQTDDTAAAQAISSQMESIKKTMANIAHENFVFNQVNTNGAFAKGVLPTGYSFLKSNSEV